MFVADYWHDVHVCRSRLLRIQVQHILCKVLFLGLWSPTNILHQDRCWHGEFYYDSVNGDEPLFLVERGVGVSE